MPDGGLREVVAVTGALMRHAQTEEEAIHLATILLSRYLAPRAQVRSQAGAGRVV